MFLFQSLWERGSPLSFQLPGMTHTDPAPQFGAAGKYSHLLKYWKCSISEMSDSPLQPKLGFTLHSHGGQGYPCGLMILGNLAKPVWVYSPCHKRTLCHVVCFQPQINFDENRHLDAVRDSSVCSNGDLEAQGSCHSYFWLNHRPFNAQGLCGAVSAVPMSLPQVKVLMTIASATSSHLPFIIQKDENSIYRIKFQRTMHKLEHQDEVLPSNQGNGFFVCQKQKVKKITGTNLFVCLKKVHILSELVCNGEVDCSFDNSDEQNCTCAAQNPPFQQLLYISVKGNCETFSPPSKPILIKTSSLRNVCVGFGRTMSHVDKMHLIDRKLNFRLSGQTKSFSKVPLSSGFPAALSWSW